MENNTYITREIKEVLLDYLSGNMTKANHILLNNWIEKDTYNYKLFHEINQLWQATSLLKEDPQYNADQAWQEVLATIKSKEKKQPTLYTRLSPWLRIAALVILVFSVGLGGGLYLKRTPIGTDALVEMSTPLHSKACITLPDSTKIWMNSGSVIRYSKNYGTNERTVQLSGEAYFKVAKNKELPFIVYTEQVNITALGTAFNVKSYPTDKCIETTLEEGSVLLTAQTNQDKTTPSVILQPNQTAHYQKEQNSFTVENVPAINYTVWKESRWVIRNEPLDHFFKMLENRYQVVIHFPSGSLQEHTFSGTIVDETLAEVLEMTKLTIPIEYYITGKEVSIQLNNKQQEKFKNLIK